MALDRARRRRRYVGLHAQSQSPIVMVGAIERGDPIPPGVYWIDSIDAEAFEDAETVQVLREAYMHLMSSAHASAFRIVRSVRHEPSMGQPGRDWILFEVLSPVPRWPVGARWGLPTIAERGLETQEGDTVQKPPPEEGILDSIAETTGIPSWAWIVGGSVLAGLLVLGLTRR